MQLHELLPRLIVENEKVKAAELDYEAAVESLKSEYTAYYPQVTISVGNNWEDDRTPSKGTYPNNTIAHDSKQGIQKSITITQMIWDAGRTNAMIDKAKATAQQAYYRLELTKEIELTEKDACEALMPILNQILGGIKEALENTPPELSADLIDMGLVLTGGGALLKNIDKLISQDTGLPVTIADDPLSCVAVGTGRALENEELFSTMLSEY